MKRTWRFSVAPVALLLIIAAGILLRLHLLATRDLWVDEALSVFLARLPWRDFWAALWNFQANMGLYYLLLRAWLHLGDSEQVVRGLSVLFGVAVIPATYLLGRRLFSQKAALASAALSSVNLFQIRYSQEARSYSLVMLLTVLSTYFFVRAVESPQRNRYWAGYVLASALGVYMHFFVYLVIGAHWLSVGYARLRLLPRKTLFLAAAAFTLITAPINLFLLSGDRGQLSWVPRPTPELVLNFSKFFTGNAGLPLVGAYAALCLLALLWRWAPEAWRASGHDDEWWSVKLVATWLFFPIASTLVVSFIKPVFFDRFMAVSAPALALMAGAGMAKLGQLRLRGLMPASLLVMLGLSVWGVHRYANSPVSRGDNWRKAVDYMLAERREGDAVFFYRASGVWPFEYYAHREMRDGVAVSPAVIFPVDTTDPKQDPDEEQVRLAIRGHERVWLVLQHYQGLADRQLAKQAIKRALQDGYRISEERQFYGVSGPIHVSLYTRNSPNGGSVTHVSGAFGQPSLGSK